MAKAGDTPEAKRLNRAVGAGEALAGVLDAAMRKRGFATRDLLLRWRDIVPPPYNQVSQPAELKWPRGGGYEGATLILRCSEGHRLALSHDAPQLAAAVNRYFGYFLVREIRLSAEPFDATRPDVRHVQPVSGETRAAVAHAVADVQDPALRDALKGLGEAVMGRKPR